MLNKSSSFQNVMLHRKMTDKMGNTLQNRTLILFRIFIKYSSLKTSFELPRRKLHLNYKQHSSSNFHSLKPPLRFPEISNRIYRFPSCSFNVVKTSSPSDGSESFFQFHFPFHLAFPAKLRNSQSKAWQRKREKT